MQNNLISILYTILLVVIVLVLTKHFSYKMNCKFIYLLFFEHFFFIIVYFVFVGQYGGDANMYYNVALMNDNIIFDTGTSFIIYISSFFVNYLYFSKFNLFLLFGFIGFFGFLYFVKLIKNYSFSLLGINVKHIIILLPGFHFWTSALGKDSIFFFFIMMLLYNFKLKKYLLSVIALGFIYMIRPHMGFILLISLLAAVVVRNPVKYRIQHVLFLFFLTPVLFVLLPHVQDFIGLAELDYANIKNKMEVFNNYGASKVDNLSSYVNVNDYNLLSKMFTYLFRPLFFDAHSILQFVMSFENLLILFILIKSFLHSKFYSIKSIAKQDLFYPFIFFYFIIGWIVLSDAMYNLGLASRQKYMLLPVLFIYLSRNSNYLYYEK